jgi:16S rRNA C967 or C1407 C5-methylase (RsmB/RsmF family)
MGESHALLSGCLCQTELGDDSNHLVPVPWLDRRFGFYSIPGNFSIAQSQVFRSGRIYGMDVSSGAAVSALVSSLEEQTKTTHTRVLDLCCSPGLKLCMIADLLSSSSTVLGVDISEQRLAVCKRIVKKYRVDPATCGRQAISDEGTARIRLYCADGTAFGVTEADSQLVFDSVAAMEDQQVAGKRKRMNKSARARERKRLRQLSSLDKPSSSATDENGPTLTVEPFDLVLVDAECSTDGSLKHVQQRALRSMAKSDDDDKTSAVASNQTLTDPKRLESLVQLQKGLISSGFNLLKPGGVLVYSTCSLSTEQNENVVQWLLEKRRDAFLIPVDKDFYVTSDSNMITTGSLEGTVRFLPGSAARGADQSFFGGGFFLAKIGKRRS